jgi:hypothetical protein
LDWALSKRVTHGDLLLMYRAWPNCSITEVFRFGCGYFGTTRNRHRISLLGDCIPPGGVAKTGDIGISPVFMSRDARFEPV